MFQFCCVFLARQIEKKKKQFFDDGFRCVMNYALMKYRWRCERVRLQVVDSFELIKLNEIVFCLFRIFNFNVIYESILTQKKEYIRKMCSVFL